MKRPIKKGEEKHTTDTSWGVVARWYDAHLHDEDSYHVKVVAPNLTRLVQLASTESLLELGCGQGFFLEKFATISKKVTGIDISEELIEIASKRNSDIEYHVGSADDESILPGRTFDVVTVVLALQNIRNISAVSHNLSRLVSARGRIYIVLNHPAFRIPQHSDWVYDEKKKTQSRIVDMYLSQAEIPIDMNPGEERRNKKKQTVSFHRSLQDFSKSFSKYGLAITKVEEWISHKKSENGPRATAEDRARKEFPMFMCLELRKLV